jgi:TolC family type I secretion outer membrane protein
MMAVTLAATGPVAAQTPAGPAPAPLPATAPAPALPPPGQKLSLPEAIALGLRQNPTIRSGVSSQSAAQYRVPQAQSGYYPRLDLFGDFGRSRLPSTSTGEDITSDALDTSLRARQLVWDFGKTSALVDEARAGVRSAEADLERLRELVVLNVRQSYFQLLAARRLVGVAEAAVQRAELNLQSARGFFEVGIRAKSDVARAEVDVANARVDLIRARNAVRFAEANLANALGLNATTPIDIEDILTYEPVVLDQGLLLRDALSNRPELAQARARLDAARAQLAGARAGWGPDLNIVGSVGTTTDPVREGLTVNESWSIGLSLSWNLFQGFFTTNRIKETLALVDVARANYDVLELQVRLDVEQAYIQVVEASERVAATDTAAESARENLRLAQGRYDAGVGTILDLTTAQLSLTQAEADQVRALTDYRVGLAVLDRAVGRP